jgi:hypothetical protein
MGPPSPATFPTAASGKSRAGLLMGVVERTQTLSYYEFPAEHWRCIRTNNPLERLMREIRRRTPVVGLTCSPKTGPS